MACPRGLELGHRGLPAPTELFELVLRGLEVAEQLVATRSVVVDRRVGELGRPNLLLRLERRDPFFELGDLLLERAERGATPLPRFGLLALARFVVVARHLRDR